jgi:GT2 family glycosyltransferase
MISTSIVIPVFNQSQFTEGCLHSLQGDSDVNETAEVIVVDNGSTDGTPELLHSFSGRWPGLKVVRFEENKGFTRACNYGAQHTKGANLCFLNNDTLPQAGWLSALSKTLQLPRVGLVGPKLLYPSDRTVNSCGYVYSRHLAAFYPIYHRYPGTFPGANRRREFQALLGACYLLKRDLFESVGGFSDFGLEDIDLCLKVRQKGLQVIYEPRAEVFHFGSMTLQHSPPGSIPPTDIRGFNERWPPQMLLEDDDRYYREDGLEVVSISAENVITLRDVVTEALRDFERAKRLRDQGDEQGAVELFEEVVGRYVGFEGAYQELLISCINRRKFDSALTWATKMTTHCSNTHQSRILLGEVAKLAGNQQLLEEVVAYLLADWTAPSEVKVQARKLVGMG